MSFPLAPAFGLQPLQDAAVHASQRLSRSLGLCLMLLLHLLGLWMVLAPDAPELLPPSAGSDVLTYVAPLAMAPPSSITPPAITPPRSRPASPPPPPSASQEPKTSSVRKPRRVASRPRKPAAISTPPDTSARAPEPAPVTAPVTAPVPISPPEPAVAQTPVAPAPEEDFSARLDAARKRRMAQVQDSAQNPNQTSSQTAEASESESERADRTARENIAFQQRGQGAQRDQSGGVFQLRSVRLHNAQFMFRGWNTNFKRDSAQLVEVEQGAETDIEMAVVKRMIALIRTQKPGKFVWKSIRAGRLVNLDASPGYDEELQQFLLKEFFPEYRSSPRR